MAGLIIHMDVDATGVYQFRVRLGRREFTTNLRPNVAASFYEDLRLLRWKSIGVHDPDEMLLKDVGDRLAALIASPETWNELRLPSDAVQVRVQFSQAAHRLMPFPWELLRVSKQFLIGAPGSHLVRDVPAPPRRARRRNPILDVVHISLGTDSALRFDEERCTLLEKLPPGIPIEFLIDPSPGHLEAMMDSFRPHIVIVSGHGCYDDLRGEHYLSTDQGYVPTAQLVELCAEHGCQLLVLSTCESARLGGPVIDDQTALPADLIAFSFPVKTTTAIQSIACLLQELVRGQSIDDAMTAVRALDIADEYAYFNSVHLHRWCSRSLRFKEEAPSLPAAPATRCPGMEMALGTLNSFAHWLEPVTLFAPVRSGGEAVVRHWAELVQRSQTHATRWRVVTDNGIILDNDDGQLVRLAHPYSFVPVPSEHLVYCDGMDRRRAKTLLAAHNPELARNVAAHPLLGIRGFVDDLISGHPVDNAVERFERENHMAERAARLNREGILYASWLFATDSAAATKFEDRAAFAEGTHDFGMPAPVILAGLENAVAARVILDLGDHLLLAPEFMLLGDHWFPNWREDHRAGFRIICGALAVVAARGTIDVKKDVRILDWAVRLEDWPSAAMICVLMCQWYGEHGRLEEMKLTIERVLPHATGMWRLVLRGHLVTIATNNGDYRTGLAENQQLEIDLQALQEHDDYDRNLQATITQQVDCLRELGRLDEAEQRWRDAHDLLPRLIEAREDAEARLLGQLAQLRDDRNDREGALDAATQAVTVATTHYCPPVLVAELRCTRADLLRQLGREDEAMQELNTVASVAMAPALRSRYLHLKALLLEDQHGAHALEHLLQSYEEDRMRGDRAGVAISLLAIARIFKEQHEYDRARARIREGLHLADECGLANIVASLALLWAEIDVAEGKNTSAATWLVTARNKFTESGDERGVADATRLLDRIRARAE
jgi:tetratricopeptide (TPR) repeat protein